MVENDSKQTIQAPWGRQFLIIIIQYALYRFASGTETPEGLILCILPSPSPVAAAHPDNLSYPYPGICKEHSRYHFS